jgi:hypothetical protein
MLTIIPPTLHDKCVPTNSIYLHSTLVEGSLTFKLFISSFVDKLNLELQALTLKNILRTCFVSIETIMKKHFSVLNRLVNNKNLRFQIFKKLIRLLVWLALLVWLVLLVLLVWLVLLVLLVLFVWLVLLV